MAILGPYKTTIAEPDLVPAPAISTPAPADQPMPTWLDPNAAPIPAQPELVPATPKQAVR